MIELGRIKSVDEHVVRQPEVSLWKAVLERAIVDALSEDVSLKDYDKESALNWIMSTSDEVNSFNYACEVINLDADKLRGRIKTALQSMRVVSRGRSRIIIN